MTDVFPTNIDLLVYNITSRYTSIKFMGAIIDTRASKLSIAGYGQFLAFQRLDTGVQLNTTIQGIGQGKEEREVRIWIFELHCHGILS